MKTYDKFMKYLKSEGLSDKRIQRYRELINIYIKPAIGKKDPKNLTNDDIIDICAYIESRNVSYNTKLTHKYLLKKFVKWLNKTFNKNLDPTLIKTGRFLATVSEKDLFTPEEIEKLISASYHPMFQFAIMFLFETGCRVGELLNLKIGDVKINNDYARVEIYQQKTKKKKVVPLILSYPFLRKLLNIHPRKDNPESSLIFTLSNPDEPMSYRNFVKHMKKIFKIAGVRWRKLHNFRHTRATLLLRENVNPEIVKKLMGWADLKMLRYYSHLTYQDVEEFMLEKAGLKNDKENNKPIKCPNCGFLNPPGFKRCGICGFPLVISKEEIEDMNAREKAMEILEIALSDKELYKYVENFFLNLIKKMIKKNLISTQDIFGK